MSTYLKKVEIEANIAYKNNPTSPMAWRSVFEKELESRTNDLKNAISDEQRANYEADICGLIISRTSKEIELKQMKQAKLLFDDALKREYCNRNVSIWIALINFYVKAGKTEMARKQFHAAINNNDCVQQIWEFWVTFEREMGRKDLTISQLKSEILKTTPTAIQPSGTAVEIRDIMTANGTVDIYSFSGIHYSVENTSESSRRSINRQHRPMALFQEPAPDIHTLKPSDEAPDVPHKILYYLAVMLTDVQILETIDMMRQMQHDYTTELDLSQQRCYDVIYSKYKTFDMSPQDIEKRCEMEMVAQYRMETEGLTRMMKDFQEILSRSGVPGFCQTEDRYQLKIQRHLIRIIELVAQDMREHQQTTN